MTPDGQARAREASAPSPCRLENDFLATLDEGQRATLYTLLRELAGQHLPHCAFRQQSSAAATDG